jgi:RNA-binding protein
LFKENTIMPLTESFKRELRGRGHALKPVVSIGNAGLSKAVLREIELSLEHHELMKIKIAGADRDARRQMIEQICATFGAELVQAIGHIALIYREIRE